MACLLTAVGAAIQIGTTNWGVVYLGRLVLGIGNGFLVTFSNIYCAEAAPAHLRAVLVALFSEWVTIGSIVGAAVTNVTSKMLDKASYQIPLGIQFIVPVVLAVGLFFVPESPRYLVNKGELEQGRAALEVLRSDSLSEEQFELEWVEMVKGIEEEKKLASSVGPLEMFKGKHSQTVHSKLSSDIREQGATCVGPCCASGLLRVSSRSPSQPLENPLAFANR